MDELKIKIMKTMYLISIFLILIGLGCNDAKKEISENDLIGTWRAIRTEEQDENGKWTKIALECSSETHIEFKNDGSFGGECCPNYFRGNYEVYENNRIKLVIVDITEAYSFLWTPKYEKHLLLRREPYTYSYSVLSDTLTISGDKFRIIHKSPNQ